MRRGQSRRISTSAKSLVARCSVIGVNSMTKKTTEPKTTMIMTKVWIVGFALASGLGLAWPANAQVKIGVGAPLTGSAAAFGSQFKNGAEQAVADINAAGGINGQKIELYYGDDMADPKQGVSVANKFVGDGVKFVVGHF